MRPWFIFLFVLITGAAIIGAIQPELSFLHLSTKPLIVLSLLACVVMNWRSSSKGILGLLMVALLFSLLGDILLMPSFGEGFFLFGLVSFLLAHLIYIWLFLKVPARPLEIPFIRRNPWMIFLMILYGGWMYLKVKDGAGEIAWAVLVYIIVIMSMAITAFNRQGAISSRSFRLVVIGALLFMISDSVLAWNRFVEPIDLSPLYILSTYAFAQLLITRGILEQSADS